MFFCFVFDFVFGFVFFATKSKNTAGDISKLKLNKKKEITENKQRRKNPERA